MPRKEKPTCVTENETFPSNLRQLLKERNVSQEVLGDAMGVRRQTVSLYTTGQSKPDADGVAIIARFFNVSADWLLGLSDTQSPDIETKAANARYGLSEKTLQGLSEWRELDFPFLIKHKRLQALNALCSHKNGHTALDHIASFLFDEMDDVTIPVKSRYKGEKLTIKQEAFSKLFLSLANDYLLKLKDDLQKQEV